MSCRPKKKVCFSCEEWFHQNNAILCEKCNQYKCSKCNACGCSVSKDILLAVRAMEKTYERWIEENCYNDGNGANKW
ncbi:unnamed protein product [marine sediment metagenome]|uniref:Uncharacterized protein n=1 Tax=marine sediment metagenome TaxID=412755 RepID=X0UHB4_9ZZZZ